MIEHADGDGAAAARGLVLPAGRSLSGMVLETGQAQEVLLAYEDRDRIARDLHDQVIQRLYAAGMSLQAIMPTMDGAYIELDAGGNRDRHQELRRLPARPGSPIVSAYRVTRASTVPDRSVSSAVVRWSLHHRPSRRTRSGRPRSRPAA